MALVPVELGGRSYEVRIAKGLLRDAAHHCTPLLRKKTVQIVTDENVTRAWREPVAASFAARGIEPRWLVLPPGEGSKSWDTLTRVIDWLLAEQVERGDHVLALGGGVIGDLVGFAAAILKRGCHFIQLPTTLLAQVDSSVGGKTAINTAAGKNLVGAFHQPSLVLADLDALATLPEREMRAGYAEVLKYGVLGDAAFFDWLAANGEAVLAREDEPLEHAVAASVAAKARIVAEDERETADRRALLNLGRITSGSETTSLVIGIERSTKRVTAQECVGSAARSILPIVSRWGGFALQPPRSCSSRNSATSASWTSRATKAWPMPRRRTKGRVPASIFLSWSMWSARRRPSQSSPSAAISPGSPAAATARPTRSASPSPISPVRAE